MLATTRPSWENNRRLQTQNLRLPSGCTSPPARHTPPRPTLERSPSSALRTTRHSCWNSDTRSGPDSSPARSHSGTDDSGPSPPVRRSCRAGGWREGLLVYVRLAHKGGTAMPQCTTVRGARLVEDVCLQDVGQVESRRQLLRQRRLACETGRRSQPARQPCPCPPSALACLARPPASAAPPPPLTGAGCAAEEDDEGALGLEEAADHAVAAQVLVPVPPPPQLAKQRRLQLILRLSWKDCGSASASWYAREPGSAGQGIGCRPATWEMSSLPLSTRCFFSSRAILTACSGAVWSSLLPCCLGRGRRGAGGAAAAAAADGAAGWGGFLPGSSAACASCPGALVPPPACPALPTPSPATRCRRRGPRRVAAGVAARAGAGGPGRGWRAADRAIHVIARRPPSLPFAAAAG